RTIRKGGADALAVASGRPAEFQALAALVVNNEEGAMAGNDRQVEFHQRSTAHVRNEARMLADRLYRIVPLGDHVGEDPAAPLYPRLRIRIFRIRCLSQHIA